ncbi:hypothetical protein HU200_010800 [Digitaria exilis]|uniref:Uncharacterized protein n=1 Tax=Digitaria exilis TaxID=1010633 RepID=A0A835FHC7_9POAL|nr:hypothetical protein HU200_010800 [Digitaria exilis]
MPAWAEAALVLASPSSAAASSSCGGVRPRAALESGRLFCKFARLDDKRGVIAPIGAVQGFPCSMRSRAGFQINNYRTRTVKIKAKTESGDGYTPLAPLRFESPSGQLLVQILQSHPHLLPATVDQQLENLQSDKDAQKEEA